MCMAGNTTPTPSKSAKTRGVLVLVTHFMGAVYQAAVAGELREP